MKQVGAFQSKRWGTVAVMRGTYLSARGPTAVILMLPNGEKLATLSVNMYKPECSHDSRDLPKDHFYVCTWGQNEEIATEALASGLFTERKDMPKAQSGFVEAPVWQLAGSAP